MMAVMYDPSVDDETIMSGFLAAYYGPAAPFIRL
eukprot:SAG22_NODE_100_length_20558_cov_10.189305_3_plen_34_part_00